VNQLSYKLRVLESPAGVRGPPPSGMLRAAGASFVIYYGLRFGTPDSRALVDRAFHDITGEMSYSDRLSSQSGLHYGSLPPIGEVPTMLTTAADAAIDDCPDASIHRSLMWIHPAFAIMVVPVVFAVPKPYIDWPYIPIRQPLAVDDILRIMDLLTDPGLVDSLGHRALADYADTSVTHIEQSMAIQLWDLDGSCVEDNSQPRKPAPYRGLEETQRYAWELSAILSFSTDHVVKDRLWLKRTPNQVFAEVSEGFAFFDDHIVFLNRNCCIEVSHLPIDLRARSRYRMQSYGYDSSSIFIWTIENLRWFAMTSLRNQYRQTVLSLMAQSEMSAASRTGLVQDRVKHGEAVDQILSVLDHLKEPRLRAIADEIEHLWLTNRIARDAQREMDKADAISNDLAKVWDQAIDSRRNTLLGVLALALALVGIPSLISQFGSWWDVRDWLSLSISAALMIMLLIAVTFMLKVRR
jgi:hypothetical protein